jgi:hypothetical protein
MFMWFVLMNWVISCDLQVDKATWLPGWVFVLLGCFFLVLLMCVIPRDLQVHRLPCWAVYLRSSQKAESAPLHTVLSEFRDPPLPSGFRDCSV